MSQRVLWLNPAVGASGDMVLAALLDVGASVGAVRDAVAATGVSDWVIEPREVMRQSLRGLHAGVSVRDVAAVPPGMQGHSHHHPHTHASELRSMIARAQPSAVATLALQAFDFIVAAEAHLHDADPATIALHEIGGRDTIVDLVGAAAALHSLNVGRVVVAPFGLGHGTVKVAHGLIPVPAPATAHIVHGLPVRGVEVGYETMTPTGAALLRAFADDFGTMPPMQVARVGYGAGTRDPHGVPNLLQAFLGESAAAAAPQALVEISVNVDDITGEHLAHVISAALEAGVCDAWATPILMKKNRPGHVVTLLTEAAAREKYCSWLLRETGSAGVRWHEVLRHASDREMHEVLVQGQRIAVKVTQQRAKPEFADVAAAAKALHLPIHEVDMQALVAYQQQQGK